MKTIWLHDWAEKNYNNLQGLDAMLSDFQMDNMQLYGMDILIASYTYEDYSGDAYVLLKRMDGKLFEVHGSHCSCYGLEGQWELEETTLESIKHRFYNGNLAFSFKDEMQKVIEVLEFGDNIPKPSELQEIWGIEYLCSLLDIVYKSTPDQLTGDSRKLYASIHRHGWDD